MTEEEFIEWSSIERRGEWIDGTVTLLQDVLSDHADLHVFLIQLVGTYIEANDWGKAYMHPFQLRLGKQRRRRLPDLFCASHAKLHMQEWTQFNGAPDLVIEVVSADSQSRDRREKFLEYEKAGITEYWLVDSVCRNFEMYVLGRGDKYRLVEPIGKSIYSVALPGLFFRPAWLKDPSFPKVLDLWRLMSRNRKKLLSSRKRRSSDNQS